jgi:hypothetical protein
LGAATIAGAASLKPLSQPSVIVSPLPLYS